jgi:hypothetical protein
MERLSSLQSRLALRARDLRGRDAPQLVEPTQRVKPIGRHKGYATVKTSRTSPYQVALAAILSASLAAVGCNSHECTLADCEAGFFTELAVPLECPQLEEFTVIVCRNERCSRGTPKCEAPPYSRERSAALDLYGPVLVEGSFSNGSTWGSGADSARRDWTLRVRVRAPSGESWMLKDGDRYTVEIVESSSGSAYISYEKVVTYERNYPNGIECDGEGGYCLFASDVPSRSGR